MRAPGTVLVVDDDAAVPDLLREALQRDGYSVIAADNAGDALDTVMNLWDRQPDAILLDVQLPTVGGQGFAELYRLLPVRQAPIILLSAPPGAPEVARQIQAQDVLSKPFDLDDLLNRVHRASLRQPTRAPPRGLRPELGSLGEPPGARGRRLSPRRRRTAIPSPASSTSSVCSRKTSVCTLISWQASFSRARGSMCHVPGWKMIVVLPSVTNAAIRPASKPSMGTSGGATTTTVRSPLRGRTSGSGPCGG